MSVWLGPPIGSFLWGQLKAAGVEGGGFKNPALTSSSPLQ